MNLELGIWCSLPVNKAWVTFLTSALGQVPFPTAIIVLGKAWRSEGNRDQEPPGITRFSTVIRSLGGAGRFSVVWKVKTPKPLWGFECAFSLMLWTSDRGEGEKIQGHLKNRREKSLATLLSSIGSKDSILFFR